MDSSTLLYLAGFFFVLGAAIVGIIWVLIAIVRQIVSKGKTAGTVDPNLAEVACLMRDVQTQDLVVQMDGKTFKTANELSSAQQHRLGFTFNVLAKWLGQTTPADAPASVVQPASPSPVDTPASGEQPASPSPVIPPEGSDWIPEETAPVEPQATYVPPFAPEPTPEVKPVSTQLPDVVGGILNPTPTPAPAFKSIAMQINDILQARKSGTPFETRGITVSDAPDHGVVVTLDGEKYPGVKDVPDESVRSLIRSAVMEWEKQSKASSK
jgi:hypothetical protein